MKMTSQGVGKPFKKEEKIMAYHACELRGSAYLTPYKKDLEVLTNISNGDSATFRYIESKENFKDIDIKANGSGFIEIFMNNIKVGYVEIKNGRVLNKELGTNSGEYEMVLKFKESNKLELLEITLY